MHRQSISGRLANPRTAITFRAIFSFVFAATVLVAVGVPRAMGSVLYSSGNDGDVSELIYTINQTSGLATPLGGSGSTAPLDLTSDWRAASFRIWAPDFDNNRLITINPTTGAGTVVGGFGTASTMQSLAFDVVTSRLYGTTAADVLHEINPTTGIATAIGPVGFFDVFALAFDLSGTLYGVSNASGSLVRINTATGAGTLIADTNIFGVTDIAARPEDGVMFGIETPGDTVFTLNLATGQTTLVGAYGAGANFMVGLAFSPVPEPSAAVLFGLGMLTIVAWRRRKRC